MCFSVVPCVVTEFLRGFSCVATEGFLCSAVVVSGSVPLCMHEGAIVPVRPGQLWTGTDSDQKQNPENNTEALRVKQDCGRVVCEKLGMEEGGVGGT